MNDWHSGNGWHEVLITEKFEKFDENCSSCQDSGCTLDERINKYGCSINDFEIDELLKLNENQLQQLLALEAQVQDISTDTIGGFSDSNVSGDDTSTNNSVGVDNTFSSDNNFVTNFVSFDDTNNFVGGDTDFTDDSGVRISNPNDVTIPEPDPFFPIEEPSGPPPLPNFDFSPAFFNNFSSSFSQLSSVQPIDETAQFLGSPPFSDSRASKVISNPSPPGSNVSITNLDGFFQNNKINTDRSFFGEYTGNILVDRDFSLINQGILTDIRTSDDPKQLREFFNVPVVIEASKALDRETAKSLYSSTALTASQNDKLINSLIDGIEIPNENVIIKLSLENPNEIEIFGEGDFVQLNPLVNKFIFPITITNTQTGLSSNYYIPSGKTLFQSEELSFQEVPIGSIKFTDQILLDIIYLIKRSIAGDKYEQILVKKNPNFWDDALNLTLDSNDVEKIIKNNPEFGSLFFTEIEQREFKNIRDTDLKPVNSSDIPIQLLDGEQGFFYIESFIEAYDSLKKDNLITPEQFLPILKDIQKILNERNGSEKQEKKFYDFLTDIYLKEIEELKEENGRDGFTVNNTEPLPSNIDSILLTARLSAQERTGFLPQRIFGEQDEIDEENNTSKTAEEEVIEIEGALLDQFFDKLEKSINVQNDIISQRDPRQDVVQQTISPNLEILNDPLIVNEIANNPEFQQQLLDLQASLGNDELFFNEFSGVITGLEKNNLNFFDITLIEDEDGNFVAVSEEVDDINDITNDIVFEETLRNTLKQTTNITDDDIEETVSQALTNRQNDEDFVFDQEILDNRSSLTNEFLQGVEDTLRENEINTLEQQFLDLPIEEQISELETQLQLGNDNVTEYLNFLQEQQAQAEEAQRLAEEEAQAQEEAQAEMKNEDGPTPNPANDDPADSQDTTNNDATDVDTTDDDATDPQDDATDPQDDDATDLSDTIENFVYYY